MPTQETLLEETILITTWTQPVTSPDLQKSFTAIAETLHRAEEEMHVLFDISNAGTIPLNAPAVALQSGFMRKPSLGRVAVVGMDGVAQTLASLASILGGKQITFFPDTEKAVEYLQKGK